MSLITLKICTNNTTTKYYSKFQIQRNTCTKCPRYKLHVAKNQRYGWLSDRRPSLLLNVYGARDLRTILITIDRERVREMAPQLARHQQGNEVQHTYTRPWNREKGLITNYIECNFEVNVAIKCVALAYQTSSLL